MTDEELIARLREGATWDDDVAAADHIEALTKERDEAEQRGYANAMEAERKLHEDRIEALEAKLAKAVEALEDIKRYSSCGDTRRKAIETLAEIKGESHD